MSQSDTDPKGGTPDPDDTDAQQALDADTATRGPQGEDGTEKGEDAGDDGLTPELRAKLDREERNRAVREAEELRNENRRLREEGYERAQPAATRDPGAAPIFDRQVQDEAYLQQIANDPNNNTVEAAHARTFFESATRGRNSTSASSSPRFPSRAAIRSASYGAR